MTPLVGRERECLLVERLVAGARVGQSGVLVLVGEAGIGKTALLDQAAAFAGDARVLRATGTESERDVPFGGLLQLLGPTLGELNGIPGPQADALAVALALRHGPAGDRLAVGAATLSLLGRYAEDRPLVVLVDDVQFLDAATVDALTFAVRRLVAEPIAVLAAVRTGEPSELLDAGLSVLDVAGIDIAAAGDLVATRSGSPASADLVARLHRATAGNPLAILELSTDLARIDVLSPDAPLPVPETLTRAFARRADGLSASARTVLLLAATAGDDLAVVGRAAECSGVPLDALAEAERAGLVTIADGRATFRHPLVRSAVYRGAAADARRAAHAAVATALPVTEVDRRAWHLAESTLGVDEAAAATVEEVGRRARDRSAHAVAATSFERAARLSPDSADRARRYVDAAGAAWLAGQGDRASELLSRARPPTAAVDGLRAQIAARRGSLAEARDLFAASAGEMAKADHDAAIGLLADTVDCCFYLCDAESAVDAAVRIDELLDGGAGARAHVLGGLAAGIAHVLAGTGGVDRIRHAVELLAEHPDLLDDPLRRAWPVRGALWLRESELGRLMVQRAVDELRDRAAVGALPYLLFHLARDDATTDAWARGESTYAEAIRLARETGQTTELAISLAGLTWLQARLGREGDCRANAAEALEVCGAHRVHVGRVWVLFALGDLELGAGRPADAATHFARLDRALDELGVRDVDLHPGVELTEVYQRLGRHEEAAACAHRYHDRAAAKGQPWALARAHRALGMCAQDDGIDGHFHAALELHARTPDVFEDARTRLAYGSRLRRARRRVDARGHLRDALATFDRLGARPWADLAATELAATGERARRRSAGAVTELTPQELQIALMLAEGRTTRQAAAALFLSPKTVDYHLRHVYTKLGVHSRPELAAALAPPARAPARAPARNDHDM